MNYKDALTHPINERLTKAKLIEISKSLQDHCLVDELTVIPMSKYYLDIRNRWHIHVNESRLLIKDVRYVASYIKNVFVNAKYKLDDIRYGEFIDGLSNR